MVSHYRISCAWNYETKANRESKKIHFSVSVKPDLHTRFNFSIAVMENEMENTDGVAYNEFGYYNVYSDRTSNFFA